MKDRDERGRLALADVASLVALSLGLVAVFLSTFAIHDYGFPVGPDGPVYLWWARLASHEGLSAVGGRPGVPALTLMIGGVLHAGPAAVIAALEVVLAASVTLGAVALVRSDRRNGRVAWVLAAGLAGFFAIHLALGYVATLAAAVCFVGASACLAHGRRRGVVAAAFLLAATAFAHPEFLAIGAAILSLAAVFSALSARRVGGPSEHVHVGAAILGGTALFTIGSIALTAGPPTLHVDTSRDDFLQHAGLGSWLASSFRQRLLDHAPIYVAQVGVPLAVIGWLASGSFLRRFLLAWGVVAVVGGALAFATGLFPAERLLTFGFVMPIGAGLGLVALWRWCSEAPRLARATLAIVLTGAVAAMTYGAVTAWVHTPPEIFPTEVARVTEAGRYAASTPPGTRLVFTVSNRQAIGSFFATQAANAIRAAVPADRIRDVYVVLPAGFGSPAAAGQEGQRLVELYRHEAFGGRAPVLWFDLAPFDRTNFARPFGATGPLDPNVLTPHVVSQGVAIVGAMPSPVSSPVDPLLPSTPRRIAETSLEVLAVLIVVGLGWSRAAVGRGLAALALAAPIGAAALLLSGIAYDRIASPIVGHLGPIAVASAVAAAGYATSFVTQERSVDAVMVAGPPATDSLR